MSVIREHYCAWGCGRTTGPDDTCLSPTCPRLANDPRDDGTREAAWVTVQDSHETQGGWMTDEERDNAIATVLRGFDEGVFVRDTTRDGEPDWAIRLFPFVRALATLAERAK